MAQGGMVGNGVKIAYAASSPVTWTSIGQILSVEIPQLTADKIDRTVSSTNDYKRSMPGMVEVSDLTFELLQDLDETTGAAQRALLGFLKAGTTIYWRVEVPADRNQSEFVALEFQGFVGSWQPSAPVDDKQVLNVSVIFDDADVTIYNAAASSIT
jgi:hypothetical protein